MTPFITPNKIYPKIIRNKNTSLKIPLTTEQMFVIISDMIDSREEEEYETNCHSRYF